MHSKRESSFWPKTDERLLIEERKPDYKKVTNEGELNYVLYSSILHCHGYERLRIFFDKSCGPGHSWYRELDTPHASHSSSWPARWLCRLLDVHPSGYYAWRRQPRSARAAEDERLTGLIKQFWLESGGIYGCRKIHGDLRDIGERCGKRRVRRLIRAAGLRAQVRYLRPRRRSGLVSVVAPNRLQQQFSVKEPNQVRVSDITQIRTHEGWLYLAVVLELHSRRVIGWLLQARIKNKLVLDALLMAVSRRKPTSMVTVHSDQGS